MAMQMWIQRLAKRKNELAYLVVAVLQARSQCLASLQQSQRKVAQKQECPCTWRQCKIKANLIRSAQSSFYRRLFRGESPWTASPAGWSKDSMVETTAPSAAEENTGGDEITAPNETVDNSGVV